MYSELFIREAVEKVLLLCKRVFVRFPRRGEGGIGSRKGGLQMLWRSDITCAKTGVRLYLKGLFHGLYA